MNAGTLVIIAILAVHSEAKASGFSGARGAAMRRFIQDHVAIDLHDWDNHLMFERAMDAALVR